MNKKSIDVKYVKQFRSGNVAAFDVIYEYYKEIIYYFALSIIKNDSEAQDIVQEVFVKVFTKIDTLKKDTSFHSWIFTLTYNHCMSIYRKNASHTNLEDVMLEKHAIGVDESTSTFDNKEILRVTTEEIQKLPFKYIQIAQLHFLYQFSSRDISKIVGIPKSTIHRQLKEITSTLQKNLTNRGFHPKKYYSLGLAPLLYEAMDLLYQQSSLNAQVFEDLKSDILSNNEVSAKIKNMNAGFNPATSVFAISATTIATISAIVVVVGLAIGFFLTQTNPNYKDHVALEEKSNQHHPIIEHVYYDTAPTRDAIEVNIELKTQVNQQDISISNKDGILGFVLNTNSLVFHVKENGVFHIEVQEDKVSMDVSNIDPHLPVIQKVEYKSNNLHLSVLDEQQRIDYTKSYALYEGKKYEVDEQGNVVGSFKNKIQLYLFDQEGTIIEYTATIK